MSEMIERVAWALRQTMATLSNPEADALARAAIKAMREPTKEMVDQFEWHKPQEAARYYWGWMIDAALTSSTASPPQSQP